jgi:hypothetical protein
MNGDCGEVPILDKRILESFDGMPPNAFGIDIRGGKRSKRFVAEVLPSSILAVSFFARCLESGSHTPYLVVE